MRKERLFFLDFVRALSTILIVLWHFNTAIWENHIVSSTFLFPTFANGCIGQLGVSLFFIISGASLMYVYQDHMDIKNYAKKRFVAIYPMFWTAYFFAFLYFFYINKSINHSIPKYRIIYSILGIDGYVNSNGISNYYILGEWFLGCIIIFYLIFPLLRKAAIKVPFILIGAVLIEYFILVNNYHFVIEVDWNILTRLLDLIIGMLFIRYIKKIKVYQIAISIIVLLLMLFVKINIDSMYKVTLAGISLFIVLAYTGVKIKKAEFQKIFQVISKYSYSIFLVHHVIISQIQSHFYGTVLNKTELLCLFIITMLTIGIFAHILLIMNRKTIAYFKDNIANRSSLE